jgi:hypothetical protein
MTELQKAFFKDLSELLKTHNAVIGSIGYEGSSLLFRVDSETIQFDGCKPFDDSVMNHSEALKFSTL